MIKAMLAAIGLVLTVGTAHGQAAYPNRPIKIVLPFAAAGGTDAVARVLAQQLSQQMGVSVLVENRAGANGNIGAEAVARAQPDGYTMLYNTSFIVKNPWLYPKLSYDATADFEPVLLSAKVPLVLLAHPSVPAKDLKEFIAYAKANPGKLSYASSGIGGVTHLASLLFQRATGIEAVHVPYRGDGPALVDLLAGAVQFYSGTVNTALPHIKAGSAKALAVTTLQRVGDLPDTPTIAETVQPGFDVFSWQGVMVPAKTPAAIVARLQREFQEALKNPLVRERLASQAAEPIGSTTEEYAAFLKKESELWGNLIKSANVRFE